MNVTTVETRTLSVAEAARYVGVSQSTLRRWFNADLPQSGQVVEGGPTGTGERRVNEDWAERKRAEVAAASVGQPLDRWWRRRNGEGQAPQQ